MKEPKTKKRFLSFVCILTCLLLVFGFLCSVGIGVWIQKNFSLTLPSDFFQLTAKGEAPTFFYYDFEDRTQRTGRKKELTGTSFDQRRAVLFDRINAV